MTLIHVYDLPGYQAVSFRGDPGPELLNDARFVDNNATSPTNAEINQFSGHTAQLAEPGNNTQVLEASQALPVGLRELSKNYHLLTILLSILERILLAPT